MKETGYEIILSYLPDRLRINMADVPIHIRDRLNEVRIRAGRPVSLVLSDCVYFVSMNGHVFSDGHKSDLLITSKEEVQEILKRLCRFSVHSFERELKQGFFTIENGIRVGVCGVRTDICSPIKYASGFNFRISREIKGCADSVYNSLFISNFCSILICGSPNSGKTTLLRDLCRLCGNKYKTTLIDERSEISASVEGISSFDIGLQTDILEGISRFDGIISAIRTLSPHIIFCDEISTSEDVIAIMSGHGCGVEFVSTVHAESFDDFNKRHDIAPLLEKHVFDYAVFLYGDSLPGKVREIRRLK